MMMMKKWKIRKKTPPQQEHPAQQEHLPQTATGRNIHNTYNTGPGSAHFLLFADGQTVIPDLNEVVHEEGEEEMQITQNAPDLNE